MTKIIKIMDTTLRDGEQTSGISFREYEKLAIAKYLLVQANVDAIEVGSARVSEGEYKAVQIICEWAKTKNLLDKVEVLAFVDKKISIDWIYKSGAKVANLLCKGSLKHLNEQLRKTPEEHVKSINEIIAHASTLGIKVNIYLEDFSNGIINSGKYVFYLLDNIKGANRFMLPDTLGIFSPEEAYHYCNEVVRKYPNLEFDFHAHNDYSLAGANSLAAVKAGITRIHTTVNGLGERAGNCALSTAVAVINDHSGSQTKVNEKKLNSLSKLVESLCGIRLSPNAPIVGDNVFTQTCGVHADGDNKGNLYFNKLLPERFGGERVYALGKTSGKASIQKNLDALGIKLDEEAQAKILKRVVELGDKKEKITISDLPFIVSDVLGTPLKESVKLKDYSLTVIANQKPVANIALEINGKTHQKEATGDGQYDAFVNAVRAICKDLKIELPVLSDYIVSIPPGGKTDALVETIVTWKDKEEETFKTKGVDCDQIIAAIKATLNMLNQVL
jgi:(R)-citramalate synthase